LFPQCMWYVLFDILWLLSSKHTSFRNCSKRYCCVRLHYHDSKSTSPCSDSWMLRAWRRSSHKMSNKKYHIQCLVKCKM
jgi:hypothetical protein